MEGLTWKNSTKGNTYTSVRTLDDVQREIRKEIDSKFAHCRRIIGKAKWRGNFSSSRRKEETFGKWNKG